MKTKQEVIQEAWGKYWDEVKDNVNGMDTNGGWADNDIIHYNEDLGCDSKDFEFAGTLYRPKSLSGIENNNGWTRIENESDLPKKLGEYHIINRWGYRSKFIVRCLRTLLEDWNRDKFTHWHPVIEPEDPIY